eukprot:5259540-Pyramimonas_sp.AAC.1
MLALTGNPTTTTTTGDGEPRQDQSSRVPFPAAPQCTLPELQGYYARLRAEVGLETENRPLLSHSTSREFDSPPEYLRMPKECQS